MRGEAPPPPSLNDSLEMRIRAAKARDAAPLPPPKRASAAVVGPSGGVSSAPERPLPGTASTSAAAGPAQAGPRAAAAPSLASASVAGGKTTVTATASPDHHRVESDGEDSSDPAAMAKAMEASRAMRRQSRRERGGTRTCSLECHCMMLCSACFSLGLVVSFGESVEVGCLAPLRCFFILFWCSVDVCLFMCLSVSQILIRVM